MKNKTFEHTAVLHESGFRHFGIRPTTAMLYGYMENQIIKVQLTIAENQSKSPAPQNDPNVKENDYWGWFDKREQKFTMIYAKRFLLDMCFPSGIDATEKHSKGKDFEGKAYRLNVVLKK
jgi:hypothetical protein